MEKEISREQYDRRRSELDEAERLAVEEHSKAAFAEEIGEGSQQATAKAKKVVDTAREKRETLRLAFNRSEENRAKRREQSHLEAHAEFVDTVEQDLKKRAKIVASITELSSKLGKEIAAHRDIQDKLARQAHNFVRDHREDFRGFGGADGFKMALSLGHDIRLVPGTIMHIESDVNMSHSCGTRHSLRGKDARDLDAQFAKKVLEQSKMLAPPVGGA